jgi:hypothetical protein
VEESIKGMEVKGKQLKGSGITHSMDRSRRLAQVYSFLLSLPLPKDKTDQATTDPDGSDPEIGVDQPTEGEMNE